MGADTPVVVKDIFSKRLADAFSYGSQRRRNVTLLDVTGLDDSVSVGPSVPACPANKPQSGAANSPHADLDAAVGASPTTTVLSAGRVAAADDIAAGGVLPETTTGRDGAATPATGANARLNDTASDRGAVVDRLQASANLSAVVPLDTSGVTVSPAATSSIVNAADNLEVAASISVTDQGLGAERPSTNEAIPSATITSGVIPLAQLAISTDIPAGGKHSASIEGSAFLQPPSPSISGAFPSQELSLRPSADVPFPSASGSASVSAFVSPQLAASVTSTMPDVTDTLIQPAVPVDAHSQTLTDASVPAQPDTFDVRVGSINSTSPNVDTAQNTVDTGASNVLGANHFGIMSPVGDNKDKGCPPRRIQATGPFDLEVSSHPKARSHPEILQLGNN
ncbi:uncharacterized protein EI90DRAFT_3288749 [Cantharellus anzutake]|uniref:uncharacterized protein n=1 Tax=Cantharellus anzutake TaxID=1750568 RepID=UPI001903B813|nr:uncharacterized protein EI90DRAFT_3288749 [Cantharellus anzutake]KAF8333141.1 hypothetical protein EI90DRAFT_3288749 [Cantharellus anzutake]